MMTIKDLENLRERAKKLNDEFLITKLSNIDLKNSIDQRILVICLEMVELLEEKAEIDEIFGDISKSLSEPVKMVV